jgi:rRNA maturation RNase YbeY
LKVILNTFDIKDKVEFPKNIKRLLLYIAEIEQCKFDEINFIIVNDTFLLKLNKQFLNHNYDTDVITFNYSKKKSLSGDIFIGLNVVKKNAERFSQSVRIELLRVMVHGILHLIGFNDATLKEKKEIRQKEEFYIRSFIKDS